MLTSTRLRVRDNQVKGSYTHLYLNTHALTLNITLFIFITLFNGTDIFSTFRLDMEYMGISHEILSIPQNIVMDLSNIMNKYVVYKHIFDFLFNVFSLL